MEIYRKSIPVSNKLIIENLKPGSLLDVGGAECPQRTNCLAEHCNPVVLLDPQKPWGETSKNITHIQDIAENITKYNVSFDNIVLSNILEHVQDPAEALQACVRVLKTDGKIHILTPNCESLNRRIGVLMGAMPDIRTIPDKEVAIGHCQTFTVDDMTGIIRDAGLKIDICRGVLLKPVPTPEMIKWPEERIQAFFDIAAEIPPDLCHEVYFRASLR